MPLLTVSGRLVVCLFGPRRLSRRHDSCLLSANERPGSINVPAGSPMRYKFINYEPKRLDRVPHGEEHEFEMQGVSGRRLAGSLGCCSISS